VASATLIATLAASLAFTSGVHAQRAAPIPTPETNTDAGMSAMAAHKKSLVFEAKGATIYYEMRGSGPVLLVIPGGPQDAGVFARLAELLADRYTVLTFDPRGNSRSPFFAEPLPLNVDIHADDAAALITLTGSGPAFVFGTSGGAQVGLNLAVRYPKLVRALVAHEPPSIMMLDDPEPALAADRALQEIYRTKGVDAAMAEFFADAGFGGNGETEQAPPEFDMLPEAAETFQRVSGNFEYWLAHGMMALSTYVPDVTALKNGQPKVAVAIGEASAGLPIDNMARALASKLAVEPVPFPGDHIGYETHAEAFAEKLHLAFSSQ
jgi:pimeloyl-ACP methyl ester carboxylesterase